MDEEDINLLSEKDDLQLVAVVLNRFLQLNGCSFTFPALSENNRRAFLWTILFQHLQNKSSSSIHLLCLAVLRVLSRDKSELDSVICEKWITVLIEKAGLYDLIGLDDESMVSPEVPDKEIAVEALKCLCNLAFNSEVARALCAHTSLAQGLVARLRVYKDMTFKEEIMLFDMKLLFILTALREDIKLKIKDELHGMDYLTSCLSELLHESSEVQEEDNACSSLAQEGPCYNLNDNLQAIFCEILKTQFNLIIRSENVSDVKEEAMYMKLIPVLAASLCAETSSEDKLMDLRSNIANLLTGVPPMYFQYLTPPLIPGENCRCEYEGRNMDALESLVQLLQYRLTNTTNTSLQYENLSPILTVLNKGARGCREQRKYLRRAILPPLKDVHHRPESGSALRNQLCRLLTTPAAPIRDLAAELLFVLCKEKVGRLVKYTGFGNAAGHLAQKGLLGGGVAGRGAGYSSSSEDSDTEEYLQAAPDIDPVVGCTRPPRQDPFEGMTDEQKEYEAMKLVNLFDRMVSGGVLRPARAGPDGRPQPISHVLELRDKPDRPPS